MTQQSEKTAERLLKVISMKPKATICGIMLVPAQHCRYSGRTVIRYSRHAHARQNAPIMTQENVSYAEFNWDNSTVIVERASDGAFVGRQIDAIYVHQP